MSAKEIIINLIDRKVLSGEEIYALIEAITKSEAYKDNYCCRPYYNYPYTYLNTQPYTITCNDATSLASDSANSVSSTSFSDKLKYAKPTVSTLDLK